MWCIWYDVFVVVENVKVCVLLLGIDLVIGIGDIFMNEWEKLFDFFFFEIG